MLLAQKAKDFHDQEALVVPISDVNEFLSKSVHREVHKLANIMGREFGESVESFLRQYATKINNDFNNT